MANYEIVIRNETSSKKSKSPVAGSDAQGQDTTAAQHKKELKAGISSGIGVATTYIKPFVDSMVTQKVSTIELRTGAAEYEQKVTRTINIVSDVAGFVSSIAMGAALGGGLGALAGAAMSAIMTSVSYAQKQERINLNNAVESVGLQFMNMRAGGSVASYSGSRLKTQ